jgi:hypothetical protein
MTFGRGNIMPGNVKTIEDGLMNSYHKEQIDALTMVTRHLDNLPASEQQTLTVSLADYLIFRGEVDEYLVNHFSETCTHTCYQSRLSACCSREGIITFFADVVVNLLVAEHSDCEKLLAVLSKPNDGYKCVYLSQEGCLWRLKPIVCQMFLCDRSKDQVFGKNFELKSDWELLGAKRKRFTWPDQPVLFDDLESYFMKSGYQSPLMYLHNSPGLLRIKQKAAAGRKMPQKK